MSELFQGFAEAAGSQDISVSVRAMLFWSKIFAQPRILITKNGPFDVLNEVLKGLALYILGFKVKRCYPSILAPAYLFHSSTFLLQQRNGSTGRPNMSYTATQPDRLPIEDIMPETVDLLLDNEDDVNKDMPSPTLLSRVESTKNLIRY